MAWLIKQISFYTSVWVAMIITGILLGFCLLFWHWLFRTENNLKITITKRTIGVFFTMFFLSQTIGINANNFFKFDANKAKQTELATKNINLNQTKKDAPKDQAKNTQTKSKKSENNKVSKQTKKQKEEQQAEAQAAKNAEEQLRLFNEQLKQLNKPNKD